MIIHRFEPPLTTGVIVKRYQRFFIDIQLHSSELVTAHCVNTGSMATVYEPGRLAALSPADKPGRKLKWTLEAIQVNDSWVGVNTHRTNLLAGEIIKSGMIDLFSGYTTFRSEVKYAGNHRIDWLLEGGNNPPCYVEVKNTTLMESSGVVSFPDSISDRARLHLEALISMVETGFRAVNLFLVNRSDATGFKPADHVDAAYGKMLRQADKAGVNLLAVVIEPGLASISFNQIIPVVL